MMNNKKGLMFWVGVAVGIAIVIAILYYFFVPWFGYPEPKEIDYDFNLDDIQNKGVNENENQNGDKLIEYKTSDNLTVFSFLRVLNDDGFDLSMDVSLAGYLQEIDGATIGVYGEDRVFRFYNGKVDWKIGGGFVDDHGNCVYEYDFDGEGNKEVKELNIKNQEEIEGWGDVYLIYRANGFSTNKPEISISGKVFLSITETDIIEVNRVSENIGSICNGYTETTTLETEEVIDFRFPILIVGLDGTDVISGDGNFIEEFSIEDTGLNNIVAVAPKLSLPADEAWEVAWDIYLP
ncbi:MAG: hypothetical protein WC548_04710 [Candidatus Pacearchaeota archaeon]